MKTYYDLSKQERKDYMKEFKQTPVGKEINIGYTLISILTLILFIATDFLTYSNAELAARLSIYALILMIAVDLIFTLYININFTAWLKNKHNIKRW